MTRNTPRTAVPRALIPVSATLLVSAVVVGLVGATHMSAVSSGEPSGTRAVAAVTANPACVTDDLTGTLLGRPRHPHSRVRDAVLRLTNTSGRTCHVQGWVDIAMVTPPGDLVPVPTDRAERAGDNDRITLKPEASAWSRVQWDLCEVGVEGCGVGVAVQYVVDPDSTGAVADLTAVPEADGAGITMKAMRVSPLQRTPAPRGSVRTSASPH